MASAEAGAAVRQQAGERFGWELAAATFLPLVLVALAALPLQDRVLWLIGISGAPHVAAGFAFYADRDAWPVLASDRRRFLVAPVALIAGFGMFGAVAGSLDERVPVTALAAFLMWQFHHFSRQNYGVLSLVARAWRLDRVSDREARLIRLGGWASMFGGLRAIRQVFGPLLVPDVLVDAAFLAGVALFVLALVELAHTAGGWRRRGMLTGLTLFHLPLFVVPAAPVALALHAAAHPFQYGTIMWRTRDGRDRRGTITMTVVLLVLATAGAWTLRHLSTGTTPFLGAAAGIGWGIVAWHFVLDAGIWRLSKPEPRSYMKRRFAFL